MAVNPENPYAQYIESDTGPAESPAPTVENPFSQYVAKRDEEPELDEDAREEANQDPGLKQVAPGVYIPADRSIADYVTGAAENIASIASSAVAEPIAGLAGIGAAIMPGGETGAEAVESTRKAMTYQPRGEVGQEQQQDIASFLEPVGEVLSAAESGMGEATLEATGSPELAALAHTVPTAALELLGLGLLRKPSAAAKRAAAAQTRVKVDPGMTPEQVANQVIDPELRSYEAIASDMRLGADVSKDVRPDSDIVAAAEELGVELNPSHYSTNEAYRHVEQTVKSQPKARLLGTREADAIKKLGEKADELIGDRGFLDKSLLDVQVRASIEGTIGNLKKAAEQTYKRVNEHIPPATKVNARASKAYLDAKLKEMGGDVSGLSKSERMLHQVLNQDRPPTYARLDQLRRDVGAGFKGRGVFADDLSGNLDQVYSALIRDQQGVANAMNVGGEFAAGRKLVQSRKDLEKKAEKMFGKEINKSILPKLTQAATKLTKGDVTEFKNLMESLPEDLRAKAAATMLNDLFTLNARGGSIGGGFARAYAGLNRNAGAKAELFKYLPKPVQRRFDAIGIVSNGIYRAKALENTSKTARDILEALESGSMTSKITDQMTDKVLGRMTFHPGPQRWLAAGAQAVKRGAKEATDKVRAADNLMASTDFNRAIAKAAEGQVKEAETMLKRSRAWQAFRNKLGEGTKKQLASMGPIAWLTQQDEQPSGQ